MIKVLKKTIQKWDKELARSHDSVDITKVYFFGILIYYCEDDFKEDIDIGKQDKKMGFK